MNARRMALYHAAWARQLSHASAGKGRNVTIARSLNTISPAATYIICTNPRSGSWLLSDGLASTSLAGNPREWFNPLVEQKRRAQWRMNHSTDLTNAEYLNHVRALGTTSNGICGIKLHYYQFDELLKKLTTSADLGELRAAELVAAAFPSIKYIWLTRYDKARQAISYRLACTTGKWWLIDGAERNKGEDKAEEPNFDPHVLIRLEHTLMENDLKWQAYFHENGIIPLTISYEDLASDYSGTIVRVLEWLGVRVADTADVRPSRFKTQSSTLNEDWLVRYKAFKADAGRLEQILSPAELSSPLAERSSKPLDVIPDSWKQWIAHNKLLKVPDEEIIEVLASNGYRRQSAIAEVATAPAPD
jgi:trehalose 2-sulfotransferase